MTPTPPVRGIAAAELRVASEIRAEATAAEIRAEIANAEIRADENVASEIRADKNVTSEAEMFDVPSTAIKGTMASLPSITVTPASTVTPALLESHPDRPKLEQNT